MYDPPGYLWAITIAGLSRSRPRPASCCTAARCGPAWPEARGAARGRRCRRARRLVHRQRGDRGSRLVPRAARPRGAVAAGRGGRLLRLLLALRRIPVVSRALASAGHGEPPGATARVPGGRGDGLPGRHGPGHLPALFALPAGLGDIAAGIAAPLVARRLARGGEPPRRPVVQRVRHDRPDCGPDPRRPHRIPADPRHPVRGADQRAPARADPDSRRAAAVCPAHHVVSALARAARTPRPATVPSARPPRANRRRQ